MLKQDSDSYGTFDTKMFAILLIPYIFDKHGKDTQGA